MENSFCLSVFRGRHYFRLGVRGPWPALCTNHFVEQTGETCFIL